MEFSEYSFRHGKEIIQITHPEILNEITNVLESLEPFAYGAKKNITPKKLIAKAFEGQGWETEIEIPLGTG
jgi:hypothetical protein